MTNIHLAAIYIPLSAIPSGLFQRPATHQPVKCYLDIISRPGVGEGNDRGWEWVGCYRILIWEIGLFKDLDVGIIASEMSFDYLNAIKSYRGSKRACGKLKESQPILSSSATIPLLIQSVFHWFRTECLRMDFPLLQRVVTSLFLVTSRATISWIIPRLLPSTDMDLRSVSMASWLVIPSSDSPFTAMSWSLTHRRPSCRTLEER